MHEPEGATAVIGDIVSSRRYPSGADLFEALAPHLAWVNEHTRPVQPLQFTVGDELQGLYSRVEDAITATLLLRLRAGEVELRFGIGVGPVLQTTVAERPFGQTGEGWWRAREAIEAVEAMQSPRRLPSRRTAVRLPDRQREAPLNAYLALQDEMISRMDQRSRAILLRLIRGQEQRHIASELGIAPSTVSKRISTSGARALVIAHKTLVSVESP